MDDTFDESRWEDIAWPGDPGTTIGTYQRRLPHWRQEGALCFVTFRLHDSLPRSVLDGWAAERRSWELAHDLSNGLSDTERRQRYLAIPEAVRRSFERDQVRKYFAELDRSHGACHLRNPEAAQIVAGALRFHHGTRVRCGDFVVMPNHVHWLLIPLPGYALERILQSVKRWTSNNLNRLVGRTGRLWQKEGFDHLVRNPEEFERIQVYIEQNPVKARLKPGEFLHYRAERL